MDLADKPYDREPTLAELVTPALARQLEPPLQQLLGPHWRLEDAAGAVLLGTGTLGPDHGRAPLRLELEPLGWLCGPDLPLLPGVAALLVRILAERWRYQMSADLHTEVVAADYLELQRRNQALQLSEARYRDLAASLELRVAEQVALIEHQQRELYQADKLASVGQLAAGVAHEINNPIGFVRSNLSTAATYVKNLGEFLAALQQRPADIQALWQHYDLDFLLQDFSALMAESQTGIDRVASIVADLKAFSAVDQSGPAPADLNEQVRTACRFAQMQLQQPDSIQLQLQPLPALTCHAGAIGQAILHLVLNALQAVQPGQQVTVSSRYTEPELSILVEDTGCGIPRDIQSRIFDPFFTTREVGQGKGLGLTVCRDVAAAHGGRLEFTSQPGAGSTFALILPLPRKQPG